MREQGFSTDRADREDAEGMVRVSHRAEPNTATTRERMEARIASRVIFYVAHHEGVLAGYSLCNELTHVENTAFVRVLIDPDHQGFGIGSTLLGRAVRIAARSIATLTTMVDSTDEHARAVAEHWGFTARETEPPDVTEENYRLILDDEAVEDPRAQARARGLDLVTLAELMTNNVALDQLKQIAGEGDEDRPQWEDGVDQSFDPRSLMLGDESIEPKLSPVLLDGETPVAANFVSPKAHIAHIAFAATARASRGQGLGTLVAKASLALAHEAGADRVTITTRTDNDAMRSVIHKLGFERFELIPMKRSLAIN